MAEQAGVEDAQQVSILERWLASNGCQLLREGARHSWFVNLALQRRSAVPRHSEINDDLVRKICRDLGIEPPRGT